MSEDRNPIIDFAAEVKKRTGKTLDKKQIAAGVPKRVIADPEEDVVAFIALEVLKLIRDKIDVNPVAVVAGLQVVGTTVGKELTDKFGKELTKKMLLSATIVSQQYTPEYSDGTQPEQSLERDPQDDP